MTDSLTPKDVRLIFCLKVFLYKKFRGAQDIITSVIALDNICPSVETPDRVLAVGPGSTQLQFEYSLCIFSRFNK